MMKRLLLITAAVLGLSAPAMAQTRALPPGEIRANGDITFGNALKLGKRESGKTIITPDTLQILGPGSTGPVGTMSLTPPGGTARTINDRAGDAPSLRDFGGPTGGDWLQPFLNAQAHASKRITVPEGAYPVSFGPFGAASKLYSGPGQIQYPDGTKDAPWRTVVTEYKAPPTGWSPSPTDQWTGDFSQFLTAARSYVTASATPPVSNSYTNMPMASMVRMAMQTDAGFNADPNDHAKGRTGQAMIDLSLRHTGQGDAGVISFNIAVGGTSPGATHFLANPASSMFGGNVYALPGAHGVYLQGSEVVYNDNGESVSAFDRTRNYWRRGNGTDQDQKWIHDRPQVKGEPGHYPIDGFYVPGGPAKRGLDFGSADFGNDGAAIVLSTNQKIYFGGYADPDGTGLRTISTSLGFASMWMDPEGHIRIKTTPGKTVVVDGLPTDASGLPSGGLYKDANGFLKVVP